MTNFLPAVCAVIKGDAIGLEARDFEELEVRGLDELD